MLLSDIGRIVEDEWIKTFAIRPYVIRDEFILMPDHMHMIVVIDKTYVGNIGAGNIGKNNVSGKNLNYTSTGDVYKKYIDENNIGGVHQNYADIKYIGEIREYGVHHNDIGEINADKNDIDDTHEYDFDEHDDNKNDIDKNDANKNNTNKNDIDKNNIDKNNTGKRDEAAPRLYGTFGCAPNGILRRAPDQISPKPQSLSSIISVFKSTCTKRIHAAGHTNFAWQARYHDSIIHDDLHMARVRDYIKQNPSKWPH